MTGQGEEPPTNDDAMAGPQKLCKRDRLTLRRTFKATPEVEPPPAKPKRKRERQPETPEQQYARLLRNAVRVEQYRAEQREIVKRERIQRLKHSITKAGWAVFWCLLLGMWLWSQVNPR